MKELRIASNNRLRNSWDRPSLQVSPRDKQKNPQGTLDLFQDSDTLVSGCHEWIPCEILRSGHIFVNTQWPGHLWIHGAKCCSDISLRKDIKYLWRRLVMGEGTQIFLCQVTKDKPRWKGSKVPPEMHLKAGSVQRQPEGEPSLRRCLTRDIL